MAGDRPVTPTGFHEGELAVQQQAGVRAEAARLSPMLDSAELTVGAASFLAQQRFATVCGRGVEGRLWVSPLAGPAGFLEAYGLHTLRVHAQPAPADPLHDLPASQDVGLLVIDFARRRRLRINGRLDAREGDRLTIEVNQSFGNCPQYIQQRHLEPADQRGTNPVSLHTLASAQPPGTQLTEDDVKQIAAADTFFLGTTHPTRGSDASHRGGPRGFVRVTDAHHLWWPDYPGNNLFNSFGNLTVDPTAALLFPDFTTGRTLYLTGTASIEKTPLGAAGDDGHTGRRATFTLERSILGPPAKLHAEQTSEYPRNPHVTT